MIDLSNKTIVIDSVLLTRNVLPVTTCILITSNDEISKFYFVTIKYKAYKF